MKNLIYIFVFSLAFASNVRSFAAEDNTINPQDFKYLVCSYIADSESMANALVQINDTTDDLTITDAQEEILEKLEDNSFSPEIYCVDLEF